MWKGGAEVGMEMSGPLLWRSDVTGEDRGDLPLVGWHIPAVLSVRKAAILPDKASFLSEAVHLCCHCPLTSYPRRFKLRMGTPWDSPSPQQKTGVS